MLQTDLRREFALDVEPGTTKLSRPPELPLSPAALLFYE
jgi:hypothetical protein